MKHRHLDYAEDTPVTELGPAAIDDILDRGTLRDWIPLAREILHDPWGPVSETVLCVLNGHEMYGTGALFRYYIDQCRSGRYLG